MRFIVDTMLGKLAKWLRILGYDTLYNPCYSDNDLFFTAHLEKRILLTRDTELASRMNPNLCLYIDDMITVNQLKQVILQYQLNTTDKIFSRCILCNELVQPISKQQVKGRVPSLVFEHVEKFVYCKTCEKIYWPGSHLKKVHQLLAELNETIKTRIS